MLPLRSLNLKLALAFAIVSLVGILLIALYVWRTTLDEFGVFMVAQNRDRLLEPWVEYYRAHGTWEGIAEAQKAPSPSRPDGDRPPNEFFGRSPVAVVDTNGRVVLAGRGYREGDIIPKKDTKLGVPILVDGKEVGRLLLGFEPSRLNMPWERFLRRFNQAFLLGGAAAIAVALLLGVLMARSLTRPLRELTAATEAVSRGELTQRIRVRSRDELGNLAEAFNRMSAQLARSQALRRQMTADIAHELRTPLSLILGHAEGLADGVLEPTQQTFDIIYDEAKRLDRLVDDLRTLSLSDAGELSLCREQISPRQLLEAAFASHRASAEAQGVRLALEADEDLPAVHVDADRIIQVLHNLLSNALRYTPQGGTITLAAHAREDELEFRVSDNGQGIPPDELPYVFERFYKSDKARQRGQGGSGLGLAIARSIVEMHGGRIWAESSPGAGASFIFTLPRAERAAEI